MASRIDFTLVHVHSVGVSREDWPFGAALRHHREHIGLSVKAAARRTKGKISDGRWYQLESGVQKIRGQEIPIGTTPSTVAAAAEAVKWSVDEALQEAGFSPTDLSPTEEKSDLAHLSDDELLSELCKRLAERHRPQPAGMRRPDGVIDYGYFQASPEPLEPDAPPVKDPQASPDK